MNCLIVSGGKFEKLKFPNKYNLIIACDKGNIYARKMNLKVDIALGDFDSSAVPKEVSNIIKVNSVKDDTDTGLAIKYALRNGYKDIDIIFALGNRFDHTIANISLLKYIAENGGKGRIIGKDIELIVIKDTRITIERKKHSYLSVFSLSDKTKINTIKGTKYDVKNIILKNSFPIGVSNEFKNKNAVIDIDKGVALIVINKKD